MTARVAHARRYPFSLTVVRRSPANPVGAGGGQCWLDAIDAANECDGCGRLPQEGCRCTPQLLDLFTARPTRRVAEDLPVQVPDRVAA